MRKACWICGNLANSGEHKVKKSILKSLYQEGFDNKTMLHFKNGQYLKIQGANSKKLKYFVLCDECNNSKTQPFDLAFDKFIDYALNNSKGIIEKRFINFYDIYGNDFPKEQANLFKYFVKIFGCDLSDNGFEVPSDLIDLLDKEHFSTRLKISFSIIEEALRLDNIKEYASGIGELITTQNNCVNKNEDSATTWYKFRTFFSYIEVSFWYGLEVEANMGSDWIANKQCVYFGSSDFKLAETELDLV